MLSSHFVGLRKEVQQIERDNDERSSIPITIRSVHNPTLLWHLSAVDLCCRINAEQAT